MSYVTWLVVGIGFCVLELVLPGGVVGALGVATLMIALLIFLGWLTTYPVAFGVWLLLSTLFLLVVRSVMRRLSPNQTSVGEADHDETLRGSLVTVTEAIPAGGTGRVSVGGTTWLASFEDFQTAAPAGEQVRLVSRDNITWNVELIAPITAGEDT